MDLEKQLQEYGLTFSDYEKLLDECSKKVNRESDKDWSEISDEFSLNLNGDTLRKASQTILGGSFVKEYYEMKEALGSSNDEQKLLSKLEDKKRELEREKIKFRDERRAWSKQNYIDARIDETLSIMENRFKDLSRFVFPVTEKSSYGISDEAKGMIVILSDWHIGQSFDNNFGKYDSKIASFRIGEYFNKIVEAGRMHNVKEVKVVAVGDMCSGSIHHTIQVTNKENLIDQIKVAAEMISSFCYQLSNEFEKVYFCNVSGNHSRLTKKEDAIHDERLDDLIGWIVGMSLMHIDNFKFDNVNIDSGINLFSFMGKDYVAVHGDFDQMSKSGIGNLCMMINKIPYAILCGHNHTSALNDINGIKIIQSGSLCGSGDQYTIEKRLSGLASQTFFICDRKGIDCIYNVDFD